MKLKKGFKAVSIGKDRFIIEVGVSTVDLRSAMLLNPAAELLFTALFEERSEKELADILLSSYDVDAETARRDVSAFILKLKERDMLD